MTVRFERCGILLVVLALLTQPCGGQEASDVGARIERLTAAGSSAAARALADSVLAAAPEESDTFVEALYWHAVLDSTAAGAERDYLRIVVEYPLAPRASAALMRLAELELARQARDRARRHLDKLRVDYPKSDHIARAQYLLARMARDDGETERACVLLSAARESVDANDVELKNQIIYLHASCVSAVPTPPTPPADSTTVRDTTARPTPRTTATAAKGQFAIQVAAYNTQREAASLARQLQRRGLPARVVGVKAPFRVRVGRYATREEAQRAMTRAGLRGIITEAEPS
jgi:cell division septation protein DedD